MLIILFKTLILLFIITVIWDLSGIIYDISKFVYEKLNKGKPYMGQQLPKIISCSYCVKFHAVWIYLIIFSNLDIIYVFGIACLGTFIGILMKKLLNKLQDKLNKL